MKEDKCSYKMTKEHACKVNILAGTTICSVFFQRKKISFHTLVQKASHSNGALITQNGLRLNCDYGKTV